MADSIEKHRLDIVKGVMDDLVGVPRPVKLVFDPIPKEHQRIIDQFIKEHNEYITNKAMIEMYSKLLKPKWYLSGTSFCIYTALTALVALMIWRVL